jgi:hypothetical protein
MSHLTMEKKMTIEIRPMTEEEKKEPILLIPQFLIDQQKWEDENPIEAKKRQDEAYTKLEAEVLKDKKAKGWKEPTFTSTSRKPKRKDIEKIITLSVQEYVANNQVKKNGLIKAIKEINKTISQNTVKRVIRKLFKQRFIEIDKTYKTKPFVIKGHYWRAI